MKWRVETSIPIGTQELVILDKSTQRALSHQHGDNVSVVCHVIGSWVTFLSDSPVDTAKPLRVYAKFYKALLEDYSGTIRLYCSLADQLLESVYHGGGATGVCQRFIGDFKNTPVFREYLHFYKTSDIPCLRFLLSFLNFAKKAPYASDDFNSTALRGWKQVETRLNDLILPTWVSSLRAIVESLLSNYQRSAFLPFHGGGSVADEGVNSDYISKTNHMVPTPVLDAYLRHLEISGINALWPRERLHPVPQSSTLLFVPKNYKTSRSICMEPASHMWAQQGVRYWVEEAIRLGALKHRVVLPDQSLNQKASRQGSVTGMIDTIDLSAASDSLSWDLVKSIFPQPVLFDLAGTRTDVVLLPDGSKQRVKKFAPMGSALCFPVQCIVYAACTILATMTVMQGVSIQDFVMSKKDIAHHSNLYARGLTPPGLRYSSLETFQVYGDDITCDFRVTSTLMDILSQLGFVVNREKSFTGLHAVRESCGKYYMAGFDITPFRYSLSPRHNIAKPMLDPSTIVGTVAMANRSYSYGYRHLAEYLYQSLIGARASGRDSGSRSFILGEHHFTYGELESPLDINIPNIQPQRKRRFNRHLQRSEAKVLALTFDQVVRYDPVDSVEDYLYTRECAVQARESIPKGNGLHFSEGHVKDLRPGLRLKWVWTPTA